MADIIGLYDLLSYINRLANNVDNIIDESLEETATEIITDTQLSTPVKTGALRRSWTHGSAESNGNNKTVELGSSLAYAQPVEEGHRQGSGYVQGRFMLRDSITKNQNELQRKLNNKLNSIR